MNTVATIVGTLAAVAVAVFLYRQDQRDRQRFAREQGAPARAREGGGRLVSNVPRTPLAGGAAVEQSGLTTPIEGGGIVRPGTV